MFAVASVFHNDLHVYHGGSSHTDHMRPRDSSTEILLPRHCLPGFQQTMNDAGAFSTGLNCCENILDCGYRLSCVNIPFLSFHICIELSVLFTYFCPVRSMCAPIEYK